MNIMKLRMKDVQLMQKKDIEEEPTLLNTIKVPLNLHYLTDQLPRPNYQPLETEEASTTQLSQHAKTGRVGGSSQERYGALKKRSFVKGEQGASYKENLMIQQNSGAKSRGSRKNSLEPLKKKYSKSPSSGKYNIINSNLKRAREMMNKKLLKQKNASLSLVINLFNFSLFLAFLMFLAKTESEV